MSVALCIYPENRLILIRSLTNIRITKNTTHVKHAPHAFQAKHSKLCLAYYRDGYKITANPGFVRADRWRYLTEYGSPICTPTCSGFFYHSLAGPARRPMGSRCSRPALRSAPGTTRLSPFGERSRKKQDVPTTKCTSGRTMNI